MSEVGKLPDEAVEVSDDELTALYLQTVTTASLWATSEERRDEVMNALYDTLVGVGPHDGEDPEP